MAQDRLLCASCIPDAYQQLGPESLVGLSLNLQQFVLVRLQVALQANTELLQLPDQFGSSDGAAILAHVSTELNSPAESTRLEALHWVRVLVCATHTCLFVCQSHCTVVPSLLWAALI